MSNLLSNWTIVKGNQHCGGSNKRGKNLDAISCLGTGSKKGSGRQFNTKDRIEEHRAKPPGRQGMIGLDYSILAIYEGGINGKAHKKGMDGIAGVKDKARFRLKLLSS